jgi:tripartite-type tricarboxylate transporter receptor subunit TctC
VAASFGRLVAIDVKPVIATALLALATAAFAQPYPNKPLRLLLTFSSGGQADILARTVTDRMRTTLGQPIVIEPKPGAGGNLAMEAVAKAPADGYTLVFGTPAVAINGRLYKSLSYDPVKDLVPLGLAAWGPYVVYASGTLPASNISELIAYAKAKPNELNYASVGVGSGTHLAAVLFTLAAGVQMTHVPYKGIQQVAPDLVAGSVHLTLNALGPLAQFVQSGRVKMLATTGARRIPALADVPTIAESGLPGFEALGWYGFFTTSGTPRDVLQRFNAELVKALNDRELAERIERMGLVPAPQSLDEAARFVGAEAQKWSGAVAASGATAE